MNQHLDAAQGVLKWPKYSIITTNLITTNFKKKNSISMPLRAQYWNGTSNEIITTNILLLCAWAVPSVVIIAITAAKGFFGLCLSKKKSQKKYNHHRDTAAKRCRRKHKEDHHYQHPAAVCLGTK